MSVVIVGGNDKMHCRYKEICRKHGCKCKVFTQCASNFTSQLGSPDLFVVFTATVSHKMVNLAAVHAEKHGIALTHCHSSSVTALKACLDRHFSI